MTYLDLSCNRLTSVPGLGAVTNLEELKLVGNQLTDLPDLSRCKKVIIYS
jgi:Leucine-rich repeat (LRR) protein